jgi:hypothetical protein
MSDNFIVPLQELPRRVWICWLKAAQATLQATSDIMMYDYAKASFMPVRNRSVNEV